MSNEKADANDSTKVPDTYTHRGAQTPIYTPPPMPNIKPTTPSKTNGDQK